MKVITVVQSKNLYEFVQMKIIFTLRKNGGFMSSSLDSRLFPVDRLAGWQADKNLAISNKLIYSNILKPGAVCIIVLV